MKFVVLACLASSVALCSSSSFGRQNGEPLNEEQIQHVLDTHFSHLGYYDQLAIAETLRSGRDSSLLPESSHFENYQDEVSGLEVKPAESDTIEEPQKYEFDEFTDDSIAPINHLDMSGYDSDDSIDLP